MFNLPTPIAMLRNADLPGGANYLQFERQPEVMHSEESEISLQLYPNPASENTQIACTGLNPGVANIYLYNNLGALVLADDLTIEDSDFGAYYLNVTSGSRGLYIVKVQQDNLVISTELVVQQ